MRAPVVNEETCYVTNGGTTPAFAELVKTLGIWGNEKKRPYEKKKKLESVEPILQQLNLLYSEADQIHQADLAAHPHSIYTFRSSGGPDGLPPKFNGEDARFH